MQRGFADAAAGKAAGKDRVLGIGRAADSPQRKINWPTIRGGLVPATTREVFSFSSVFCILGPGVAMKLITIGRCFMVVPLVVDINSKHLDVAVYHGEPQPSRPFVEMYTHSGTVATMTFNPARPSRIPE